LMHYSITPRLHYSENLPMRTSPLMARLKQLLKSVPLLSFHRCNYLSVELLAGKTCQPRTP
jgi:hypothetical protein